MKILYLSCHSILEYDELKLFEELGYDYFSLGAYIDPKQPHDPKRPALNGKYHEHLASVSMVHGKENLHEEQIEWADVIIVMHVPEWIEKNWDKIKHKRVIWRSIGQSIGAVEKRLQPYKALGLEIVRYSPAEANIPNFAGQDGLIRFYKDPDEFKAWNGDQLEVVTFAQSMKSRGEFCNYDAFRQATIGWNARVYGPNNEDAGELNGGLQSYDKLKQKMRDARVYFYAGTQPAAYTLNFIEAWMTGAPIVALGEAFNQYYQHDAYEVPQLIDNGVNGYCSNSLKDIQLVMKQLFEDKQMAINMGKAGREKAIKVFGKDTIKQAWKEYLE